ncbi:ABC transporter permease subunit [Bacillus sp. MCCB 382]|uniref:ABC transporter permease n=1 Tax=Bacillus sp. MCCB 382 TaxID=2860197 RepID=UPI001C596BB0|nr:ABC transporter permease subunit [Bacillus sp. MCCB 382]
MVKSLFTNKRFLVGFLFITLLLSASISNTILNQGNIRDMDALYENGQIVETAPFKPSFKFPLGTDANGNDLLHVIVEGAKYTIGISICIAFVQIILGALIGTILSGYFKRTFNVLENFLGTFSVIPITLISYFILINVLSMPIDGFAEPFYKRALFEAVILILLPLPSVVLYVSKETQKIFQTEYVIASRTLGASTFRILVFHVTKHLIQKLVILFIQQLNQVLIILAHLGLLKMFFGGTVIDFSPMQDPPKTLSFEWSGLIGDYFEMLYIHPFIVLVPITFFALTIVSINLILNGVESVYEAGYGEAADEGMSDETLPETHEHDLHERDFIRVGRESVPRKTY